MKKKGIKRKLLDAGLIAALTVHVASNAFYWTNRSDQIDNPDPMVVQAMDACDTQIFVPEGGAEPVQISQLEHVCDTLTSLDGFTPNTIEFESDEYLKKDIIGQIAVIMKNEYSGHANPVSEAIVFAPSARMSTMYHEFAHQKHFTVAKTNPEFASRWLELTVDENGESLYETNNELEYGLRKIGWFTDIAELVGSEPDYSYDESFVSKYAQRHFYEDVAETTEAVYDSFEGISKDFDHPIIQQKLQLLEEYGFIPAGSIDLIELNKRERRGLECYRSTCAASEKTPQYIAAAEDFLEQYPNHPERIDLMLDLARAHAYNLSNDDDLSGRDRAFKIWEKVLSENSDFWTVISPAASSMNTMYARGAGFEEGFNCTNSISTIMYNGENLPNTQEEEMAMRDELLSCLQYKDTIQNERKY